MVKLIHAVTGSEMWVAERRLEEYLAAGHRLAAPPEPKKKGKRNQKTEAPSQSPPSAATAPPQGGAK